MSQGTLNVGTETRSRTKQSVLFWPLVGGIINPAGFADLLKGRIAMGYGLLNLGSLAFGLISWILPLISLLKRDKAKNRNWGSFSMASAIACSISLFMQILYGSHLVRIEDWSALMDTSNTAASLSLALILVTIALNIATFAVYNRIGKRKFE
jgi:cytochrome c oxidase subunit 4